MERRIPKEQLESIAIFGRTEVTTACIQECLKRGITICYYSTTGKYFGRLSSTSHTNIRRLRKQIYLSDDERFSLELSKRFIAAKMHNQLVLLRRYMRSTGVDVNPEITQIKILERKIETVSSSQSLLGYEGSGAKYYFQALSKLISEEFRFNGRTRMPPRDPFNSMISLGYTVLLNEMCGVIESHNLSSYAGFLHKDQERHPTLASDLIEEWRAPLVDATVMSLIQGKEIAVDQFDKDEESGAVILSNQAFKTFIRKFENKLGSETGYIGKTYRMSFRKALNHQVTKLKSAIEWNDPSKYEPIRIR